MLQMPKSTSLTATEIRSARAPSVPVALTEASGQRLHDESVDRTADGDDGTPQHGCHEAQPGQRLAGRAGHLLGQADEAADDQEDGDDDRQVDGDPGAVPGDRMDGRCTIEIGRVGMEAIPDQADDGAGDEQRAEQPVPGKLLGSWACGHPVLL